MNEQFPLEQVITHRKEPFQFFFAVRAREAVPESDDYLLEPGSEGLRLHAANETALGRPKELLLDCFGDEIDFMPLDVKVRKHEAVTYEPMMFVRTEVRAATQPFVRGTLRARGATILEEDAQRSFVVTRALGPLRNLLGFPAVLHRVAGDSARLWTWLSHYAPTDPEGGGKAA